MLQDDDVLDDDVDDEALDTIQDSRISQVMRRELVHRRKIEALMDARKYAASDDWAIDWDEDD